MTRFMRITSLFRGPRGWGPATESLWPEAAGANTSERAWDTYDVSRALGGGRQCRWDRAQATERFVLDLAAAFLADPEVSGDLPVAPDAVAVEAVASGEHLTVLSRQHSQHRRDVVALLVLDRALQRVDRLWVGDELTKRGRVFADGLIERCGDVRRGAQRMHGALAQLG